MICGWDHGRFGALVCVLFGYTNRVTLSIFTTRQPCLPQCDHKDSPKMCGWKKTWQRCLPWRSSGCKADCLSPLLPKAACLPPEFVSQSRCCISLTTVYLFVKQMALPAQPTTLSIPSQYYFICICITCSHLLLLSVHVNIQASKCSMSRILPFRPLGHQATDYPAHLSP